MIVRPSVVLPQPDSPTTPSVSPRDGEVDPVHGPDLPDRVLEDARLDREVLDETLDAEDLVAVRRLARVAAISRVRLGHETAPTRARADSSSSAKWHADR